MFNNSVFTSRTCSQRHFVDGCIRFHRAQFLDVLVSHLPEGVAHFGKRLTTYNNLPKSHGGDTPIALRFADGSTAVCDLLVGCDGIKSTIRKQMLEEHVHTRGGDRKLLDHFDPVWSGTIAYRALIPVQRLVKPGGQKHRTIDSPMMVRVGTCLNFEVALAYSKDGISIAERTRYTTPFQNTRLPGALIRE